MAARPILPAFIAVLALLLYAGVRGKSFAHAGVLGFGLGSDWRRRFLSALSGSSRTRVNNWFR